MQAVDNEPTNKQINQANAFQSSEQGGTGSSYAGLCLVFNMVDFEDIPATRAASDPTSLGFLAVKDNIERIFHNKLGYKVLEVKIEKNDGRPELLSILINYLQCQEFHRTAKAFVMFFMSYGSSEKITCNDGGNLPWSELRDLIAKNQCTALLAKPKLVFIQVCEQNKVKTDVPDQFQGWVSGFAAGENDHLLSDDEQRGNRNQIAQSKSLVEKENTITYFSDILIAFSSVPIYPYAIQYSRHKAARTFNLFFLLSTFVFDCC